MTKDEYKEAWRSGYDRGYKDSKEYESKKRTIAYVEGAVHGRNKAIEELKNTDTYQMGLDDAWECMRKLLFLTPQERGKMLDCEEATIQEVFDYSAEEAIAKVKENEPKVTKKYCAECGQLRITDEGRCILCHKDLCHEKDKWIPEQDTDNIEVAYDEETRSYSYTVKGEAE